MTCSSEDPAASVVLAAIVMALTKFRQCRDETPETGSATASVGRRAPHRAGYRPRRGAGHLAGNSIYKHSVVRQYLPCALWRGRADICNFYAACGRCHAARAIRVRGARHARSCRRARGDRPRAPAIHSDHRRADCRTNYFLRAEDGTLVHILNRSFNCGLGSSGGERAWFQPTFEAPKDSAYEWLTRGTFVAMLEMDPPPAPGGGVSGAAPPMAIRIRFYQIK
jgi:hypothetical protein